MHGIARSQSDEHIPCLFDQIRAAFLEGQGCKWPHVDCFKGQQHCVARKLGYDSQAGRRDTIRVRLQRTECLVFDAVSNRQERSIITNLTKPDGPVQARGQVGNPRLPVDDLYEQQSFLDALSAKGCDPTKRRSLRHLDRHDAVPESSEQRCHVNCPRALVRHAEEQVSELCSSNANRNCNQHRRGFRERSKYTAEKSEK